MLQNYLEGEGLQSNAIKEIQSKGVTIHYWSNDILDTYRRTWEEVVKEQQAKSPEFAKVWASLSKFREEYKV
jgi:TRAP-type mannitol/chloroaromatic compound transport system substrate-binding protein